MEGAAEEEGRACGCCWGSISVASLVRALAAASGAGRRRQPRAQEDRGSLERGQKYKHGGGSRKSILRRISSPSCMKLLPAPPSSRGCHRCIVVPHRYKIDECKPNSSSVTIDPRMSTIYVEAAGLVGTDGPRKELINFLTSTGEKMLNVVSIMGFRGLDKTTLAKQMYDEIRGQYDCTVFAPVSQRPNMTGFLTGLLYSICIQLKLEMERSSPACELQDIINDVR